MRFKMAALNEGDSRILLCSWGGDLRLAMIKVGSECRVYPTNINDSAHVRSSSRSPGAEVLHENLSFARQESLIRIRHKNLMNTHQESLIS